jgi:ATP-binding cassette, subfamily C, bacterial
VSGEPRDPRQSGAAPEGAGGEPQGGGVESRGGVPQGGGAESRTLLPTADARTTRAAIFTLLRPHRALGALASLVLVAEAVAGLLVPPLLGHLVQLVSDGRSASALTTTVVALLAVTLAEGVLGGVGRVLVARLGEPVLARLRERVVDRVLGLRIGDVERAGSGDVLARVGDDVAHVAVALREAIPAMAGAGLTIGLTIVGLAALDWRLALAGLCAVPIQAWTLRWYLGASNPVYTAQRRAGSGRAQQLLETLGGLPTVRAFGLERAHHGLVEARSQEVLDLSVETVRVQTRFYGRLNAAELVGCAAILVVSFYLVRDGAIDIGAATAAALYFIRLFNPINTLLALVDELQSAGASLARLVGVAELPNPDDPPRRQTQPGLRLRGIHHAYVAGREVLHDVDLDIAAGERVALVGESGSGKTTLARLAAGVEPPQQGTVDGPPATLVTQEVHVFAGPLADDLRLAAPNATETELRAALDQVGAAWVDTLPEGLATIVGDGGHRLDATQSQQLALARLVLADRPVAVLDEATAESGSAGARVLEASARAAMDGRTALVVAHRLTQALDCDRIVVLHDGRVVEQGAHDELVAAGGRYAELWAAWATARS